jgi:multicomponent Na+:H+ antiporter subunit C
VSVTSALIVSVLFGVGVYLLLQRTLTRIILGIALMGHAANLLLLVAGGPPGRQPIVGRFTEAERLAGEVTDPLPQALALTAIVISFGITAFLLSLAYRSWVLHRDDEVEDDLEDRRIARLGERELGEWTSWWKRLGERRR